MLELLFWCIGPKERHGTAFPGQRERGRAEPRMMLRHRDDGLNSRTLLPACSQGNLASASSSSQGSATVTCRRVLAGGTERQTWRQATCGAVAINICEILEYLVFQMPSTRRAVVYQRARIIILCGSPCSRSKSPFITRGTVLKKKGGGGV